MTTVLYFIISFINVFIHVTKNILVIKGNKWVASTANCITYTFSAIVVKFIAETDLTVAMLVAATTNFLGCWCGMWVCEKFHINNSLKLCGI